MLGFFLKDHLAVKDIALLCVHKRAAQSFGIALNKVAIQYHLHTGKVNALGISPFVVHIVTVSKCILK